MVLPIGDAPHQLRSEQKKLLRAMYGGKVVIRLVLLEQLNEFRIGSGGTKVAGVAQYLAVCTFAEGCFFLWNSRQVWELGERDFGPGESR